MSETSTLPMTCARCSDLLGADVYIGPSGHFYCKKCRDKARQSSPISSRKTLAEQWAEEDDAEHEGRR